MTQRMEQAKRRSKGDGSVTQLSDGRWQGRVDLGWVDGKRKMKAVYGRTKTEALDRVRKTVRERDDGKKPLDERLTVEAFLMTWLEESAKPSVRPTTYAFYAEIVRLHLKPTLGKLRLAKLDVADVQKLLNDKRTAGLSAGRVQRIRATLRRALNVAMRWGKVHRNVATLVDIPGTKPAKVRPLTPGQARTFLAAIEGDRLEALYVVALGTGLRQGEALALRWQEIDLEAGRLTINHTLTWADGSPVLGPPKTESSHRTLALPAFVVAALRTHRARQNAERLSAGPAWEPGDYVFTGERRPGRPLHPSTVTHLFQRVLKDHDLPHQRFHDLRHGCASLLLSQGLSLKDVQDTLGHAQISLTANLYGHLFDERRQEIATRMDAILGAPHA